MELFDDTRQSILISDASANRTYQLYTIAAAVILVYDAIITCEDEVRYIWRRRFDITTALYIVNKYVEMAACICGLVLLFPVSTEMCYRWTIFQLICLLLLLIAWAFFSGIRVYALTGRKKLLATVVFTLSLMFIVPNLYLLSRANFDIFNQYPYPSNCGGLAIRVGASSSTLIPLLLIARTCTLLGECIAIAIILRVGYRQRSSLSDWNTTSRTIIDLLLMNGVSSFSIPLVLNVLTTAFLITDTHDAIFASESIRAFRDSLTSILISRFLLDIGRLAENHINNADRRDSGVLTTHFASELSTATYAAMDPDQSMQAGNQLRDVLRFHRTW